MLTRPTPFDTHDRNSSRRILMLTCITSAIHHPQSSRHRGTTDKLQKQTHALFSRCNCRSFFFFFFFKAIRYCYYYGSSVVLSHWDFSHGKFRSFSLGESQLRQSYATQPTVRAGCFSVSIIHRTLTWTT